MLADILGLSNMDVNPVFHRKQYGKFCIERYMDRYVQNSLGDTQWERLVLPYFINRDKYTMQLSMLRFQRCVFKSHEKYDQLLLKNLPIVYLVRDGRDSLVSYYFQFVKNRGYTKTFDSFLRSYLKKEARSFEEDYLNRVMGDWGENIESYLNKPNTLIIRYEDMKTNPIASIKDILRFLDQACDIQDELIKKTVIQHEKDLLTRDQYLHGARGQVGGWRKVFTRQQADMFWNEHHVHLTLFGYAKY